MVDDRLTDHMKQVLVLKHEELNQSEIAGLLGMTRQAVSKILKTIPERSRELPDLDLLPGNYLASIHRSEGQKE
ncbi:hypothetical protein CSC3H3_05420 [Thalassospira marina]|uniref:RNA polymerase sigma-70 region 4 domain-containing protein n=1 Tax=Thalassospira marina TaxID=2048283 RepID=A0ABN5FL33_9PROT|nr:hypothetical protein CSC3H3_05420 [Thalassospira marina]